MADKQVICLVVCNQAFVATSTGWGTSSITGSTSAATATVTINLKSYNSDKLFGWFLDECGWFVGDKLMF
jgi:hypothetical protein